MDASFEEKSVWITLVSLVVIFGGYFVVAARMLAMGITAVPAYLPLFVVVVALLVVVLAGAHAAAAVLARPEGRDERDQLISWRAENNSSWVLGLGVLVAIFGLATAVDRAWIANWLLLALLLSEVLKYSLQAVYYRRGL